MLRRIHYEMQCVVVKVVKCHPSQPHIEERYFMLSNMANILFILLPYLHQILNMLFIFKYKIVYISSRSLSIIKKVLKHSVYNDMVVVDYFVVNYRLKLYA